MNNDMSSAAMPRLPRAWSVDASIQSSLAEQRVEAERNGPIAPDYDAENLLAFVANENIRHPESRIRFAASYVQFAQHIDELARRSSRQGPSRTNFVLLGNGPNGSENVRGMHAVAFHVECLDGKASVLGVDSLGPRSKMLGAVLRQLFNALKARNVDASLGMVGLNIQHSGAAGQAGDCGQFSMHVARQMRRHPDEMHELSDRLKRVRDERSLPPDAGENIGAYSPNAWWMEQNECVNDALLPHVPARFFKHQQSRAAMDAVQAVNHEVGASSVSSKQPMTAKERMLRFQPGAVGSAPWPDATHNVSINVKRLKKLEQMQALPFEQLRAEMKTTLDEAVRPVPAR